MKHSVAAKPGEVFIIGTSHISRSSVREVSDEIRRQRPAVVALELDIRRAHALTTKPRSPGLGDIRLIGVRGFLLAWVGYWLQRRLGRMAGIEPGSELRAALETAHEVGASIAFIDQDISVTLQRLARELSWKEKFRMLWELFLGERLRIDVEKPSRTSVRKLVSVMRKRYPAVHRVLIDERNRYMARRLAEISGSGMSVVAVVGLGHKEGIERILKKGGRAHHIRGIQESS